MTSQKTQHRIVVGLSGGVDSSVAALLLKEAGHEVIGLFMRNWHDESVTLEADCPWIEDSRDALLTAQRLGIPFQVIDLSEAYKRRIVDYMFAEYEAGRTPNPDVLCNREIKFDLFLKAALKLGADYVATGHYARREAIEKGGKPYYRLLAGRDPQKDQSYFLCQLSQEQLSHALFPIGELEKSEVRRIAREASLPTAEKKDSQGLCFVGKVHLPDFLQQQLKPRQGQVIEVPADADVFLRDHPPLNGQPSPEALSAWTAPYVYKRQDGQVVGSHQGAYYFTIGQRRGLGVGGKEEPLFVIATDIDHNIVYTGMGDRHPGLYRKGLFIKSAELHWLRTDLALAPGEYMPVQARIRYRQALEEAVLYQTDEGAYLIFSEAQRGITPGQFAAWYVEEELLGSGVIA